MKKVLLSLAVVAALGMTSCGGADFCSCAEKELENIKAIEAAGDDEAKIKELEEGFKSTKEECDKLGDKFKEDMKDKSEEEMMKEFQKLQDDCPAFKELMGK